MNIRRYYGKKVLITTEKQEKIEGSVIDYVFQEDNVRVC